MSVFDTVMSDTVGVAWRAASGTVDPWTKQEIIDNATQEQIAAGADPSTAAQDNQNIVTDVLTNQPGGSADPSAFSAGLKNSFGSLGNITGAISKNILYIGIGVALIAVVLLIAEHKVLNV